MADTIEKKVAEAILQQPIEISVGTHTYTIAPPSIATLIMASEAVSRLPHLKLDTEKVVEETLSVAKDCRAMGEIVAILILGAKRLRERNVRRVKRQYRLFRGLIKFCTYKDVDEKEQLTDELLETLTPEELYLLLAQILTKMQIQDFFGLTTFLCEINLLRQTKVD